jgi:hypothetical protein
MSCNQPQPDAPRETEAAATQAPGHCAPGAPADSPCGGKMGEQQVPPWAAMLARCGCGSSETKTEGRPPEMI